MAKRQQELDRGVVRMLAREGQPSRDPVSNSTIVRLDDAAISGGGHVLFSAQILTASGQAGTGLYLWDPARGTMLVTCTGDELKASGSKSFIVLMMYTGPSKPERSRRMGVPVRFSYSDKACRHIPQGEMGRLLLPLIE